VINTGEKAFDYWKRKKVHPNSPHWEKPFETLQKLRIWTLALFAASEISNQEAGICTLRKVICSIFALISYSHDMCKILF
jgi:hypothetical protein